MDETTKAAMNEFVLQTIAAAKAGAAWTADQAPLVVQEWLRWRLAESALSLAAACIAVAVIGYGVYRGHCAIQDKSSKARSFDDPEFLYIPLLIVGGVPLLLSILAIGGNALAVVKVLVAPRVVVIEQLAQWLK